MRKRTLAALCLLLATLQPARAAFDQPLLAPRAAAMGGASLGALDDSTAMFLNVAGIGGLRKPELYMMYSSMYTGMDGVAPMSQSFITAGVPTRYGTFGFGMGEFKATNLLAERTYSLGYARAINSRLRVGIAGKVLEHGYYPGSDPLASQDPVFQNGTSRAAFGVDLGVVGDIWHGLELGVSVQNINRPDVGLASEDRVPREVRVGLGYGISGLGLRATGELVTRSQPTFGPWGAATPIFGLEKSVMNGLAAFRVGAGPLDFSAGVGITKGSFGFDYSLTWSRTITAGHYGTHLVGIRYQFGGPHGLGRSGGPSAAATPVAAPLTAADRRPPFAVIR